MKDHWGRVDEIDSIRKPTICTICDAGRGLRFKTPFELTNSRTLFLKFFGPHRIKTPSEANNPTSFANLTKLVEKLVVY